MGFLLINKPKNWTSHDIVAKLRNLLGEKKIGHAGTLDPFATGLLIIGVGREFTRKLDEFKAMEKEYEVVTKFGFVSDTQDIDGKILKTKFSQFSENSEPSKSSQKTKPSTKITSQDIKNILPKFIGKIQQIPPMFSAKKIKGQKLYNLARKGQEIAREPVKIFIKKIELLDFDETRARLKVICGTGTYIRTLVHDIGQELGCGAYAEELTRTRIGKYKLKDAQKIEDVKEGVKKVN